MELLFSLIALTTMWVLAIKIVTSDGMALEKLGHYGDKKAAEGAGWIDPLFYCPWCMASVHSWIVFFFAVGMGIVPELHWKLVLYYPFVVAGSSLAAGLIWQYHTAKNVTKELQEAQTTEAELNSMLMNVDLNEIEQLQHEQTHN